MPLLTLHSYRLHIRASFSTLDYIFLPLSAQSRELCLILFPALRLGQIT